MQFFLGKLFLKFTKPSLVEFISTFARFKLIRIFLKVDRRLNLTGRLIVTEGYVVVEGQTVGSDQGGSHMRVDDFLDFGDPERRRFKDVHRRYQPVNQVLPQGAVVDPEVERCLGRPEFDFRWNIGRVRMCHQEAPRPFVHLFRLDFILRFSLGLFYLIN